MRKKYAHGGSRPGAGRPRIYHKPRARLTVEIDVETLAALDRWRTMRDWTRARTVEDALLMYLKRKR